MNYSYADKRGGFSEWERNVVHKAKTQHSNFIRDKKLLAQSEPPMPGEKLLVVKPSLAGECCCLSCCARAAAYRISRVTHSLIGYCVSHDPDLLPQELLLEPDAHCVAMAKAHSQLSIGDIVSVCPLEHWWTKDYTVWGVLTQITYPSTILKLSPTYTARYDEHMLVRLVPKKSVLYWELYDACLGGAKVVPDFYYDQARAETDKSQWAAIKQSRQARTKRQAIRGTQTTSHFGQTSRRTLDF